MRTSGVTIQALGTRFNVYEEGQATRVAVLEGRVRVTSPGLKRSLELGAGEMASVTPRLVERASHADVKAATAWRDHSLVFERARLVDVAREFNRYNAVQFRVDASVDDSYRLSGTFDAVHPESLLLWLQSRGDLSVRREGLEYSIQEVGGRLAERP